MNNKTQPLGKNRDLNQINNFKDFNLEGDFEGMIYEDLGHIIIGRVGYLPVAWDSNGKCIIAMVEDKTRFDLKFV